MMDFRNVTSFHQNKEALMRRKQKVIFFQEHKVRKNEPRRIRMTLP